MKAVIVEQYGGPEVLKYREIEKPELQPGTVLVKLLAAGINPVDTYLRSGTQGYAPPLPWTPGMDGAGTVEAIGDGLESMDIPALGSRVYTAGSITGTYAEYALCHPSRIFPLPEELDFFQGASLGAPYFTAARALFTLGKLKQGETVLIHGASGGVGIAALQLAADRACRLFGTAGSDEGRDLVEGLNAMCFDHRKKEHYDAVRKQGGVDLIVEMLANINLDDDLGILNVGGRVMVVGSRGRVEIAPRDLMSTESMVAGVKILNASDDERRYYAGLVAEGAKIGRVCPIVDRVFPLAEAAAAHRQLMDAPHKGSLVLTQPQTQNG